MKSNNPWNILLNRVIYPIVIIIIATYWVLITTSLFPKYIQYLGTIYSTASFEYKTIPMAYAALVVLGILVLIYPSIKFWVNYISSQKHKKCSPSASGRGGINER